MLFLLQNTKVLQSKLPNAVSYPIEIQHIDFLMAKNVKEMVYHPVLYFISQYVT